MISTKFSLIIGLAMASSVMASKECRILSATGPPTIVNSFTTQDHSMFKSPAMIKNDEGALVSAMFADFETKYGLVFSPSTPQSGPLAISVVYSKGGVDGTIDIETLANEVCIVKGSSEWDSTGSIHTIALSSKRSKEKKKVPNCKVVEFTEDDRYDTSKTINQVQKNIFESTNKITYRLGSTSPALTAKFVDGEGLTISTAPAYPDTPKVAIVYQTKDGHSKTTYAASPKKGSCVVKDSQGWWWAETMTFITAA